MITNFLKLQETISNSSPTFLKLLMSLQLISTTLLWSYHLHHRLSGSSTTTKDPTICQELSLGPKVHGTLVQLPPIGILHIYPPPGHHVVNSSLWWLKMPWRSG